MILDNQTNHFNASVLEEIRRITREIAETGAIPFAVGGDHAVPNGTFSGIIDVYGRKNVGFVHFDVVEFNPFYDNRGEQTARLVRRIMLQFLTGIAMKERGLDPDYIHPRVSGKP